MVNGNKHRAHHSYCQIANSLIHSAVAMNRIFNTGASLVIGAACLLPLQTSADDGADSTSSTNSAYITGRIEQTESPQATLPLALTKLKAETPKMDVVPPTVLKGGVSELSSQTSFPPSLLGFWGGALKIVSEYHRSTAPPDPDRTPGTVGMVVFHFYQDGKDIKLKPATVFLPHIAKPLKDCFLDPDVLQAMEERAAERGRELNPNRIMERNPVISLGAHNWARLNGATSKATVTANTLHNLSPDVIEQDVVDRNEGSTASGRDTGGYIEVICRFEKTGPDSEFVRVAKVVYNTDRTILRRVLLEGALTRNWQEYADRISRQLNQPWERIVQRNDI